MKKLLSLLSLLTISGTAIPTTIAASSYENKENNNISYNFDINYDDNKILGTMSSDSKTVTREVVFIEDWTKYEHNWEDFEKKFSKIEFIGLNAQLGGQGDTVTVNEFKMPIKLSSFVKLINYHYHFLVCEQVSKIELELFLDGKQLKIRHKYFLSSNNAIERTWAWLRYNSIRIIGK